MLSNVNIISHKRLYFFIVTVSSKAIKMVDCNTRTKIRVPLHTSDDDKVSSSTGQSLSPRMEAPIRPDHPLKITWDILTFFLSMTVGLYFFHASIENRCYHEDLRNCLHLHHQSSSDNNQMMQIPTLNVDGRELNVIGIFVECWFMVDIFLNFFTREFRLGGSTQVACWRDVVIRYLTTWFAIDILAFIPWERFVVQRIVATMAKWRPLRKAVHRGSVIIRATPQVVRNLRIGNIRKFLRVAKHSGLGRVKLFSKILRCFPQYTLFYRKLKGVLIIRALRQLHWGTKIYKSLVANNTSITYKSFILNTWKIVRYTVYVVAIMQVYNGVDLRAFVLPMVLISGTFSIEMSFSYRGREK